MQHKYEGNSQVKRAYARTKISLACIHEAINPVTKQKTKQNAKKKKKKVGGGGGWGGKKPPKKERDYSAERGFTDQ